MSPKFVYVFYLVGTTPEKILVKIFALQIVVSKFVFFAMSKIAKIEQTMTLYQICYAVKYL